MTVVVDFDELRERIFITTANDIYFSYYNLELIGRETNHFTL